MIIDSGELRNRSLRRVATRSVVGFAGVVVVWYGKVRSVVLVKALYTCSSLCLGCICRFVSLSLTSSSLAVVFCLPSETLFICPLWLFRVDFCLPLFSFHSGWVWVGSTFIVSITHRSVVYHSFTNHGTWSILGVLWVQIAIWVVGKGWEVNRWILGGRLCFWSWILNRIICSFIS